VLSAVAQPGSHICGSPCFPKNGDVDSILDVVQAEAGGL
jgi:hypothetical protein